MQSTWVKLALVALMVASLGLKARSDAGAPPPYSPAGLGILSDQGFVFAEIGGLEGPAWSASNRDCRIEITEVSPLGWHQAAMGARAGDGRVAYVYDARLYDEQPVTLTKLGYYWHKLVNYFDPAAMQPPVFAVATSAGCAAQSIQFERIAQQLGR